MSSNSPITNPQKVPEFVYANNGAKYHPCQYCCRAFAHKRYLTLHMKACIRTHLNEDDHKPSVSFFPNPAKEQPTETPANSVLELSLSNEITIEKRPKQPIEMKRTQIKENQLEEEGGNDEPSPKIPKQTNSSGDENANMPQTKKYSLQNACKLCDEIFSSLDELIMHAKIEHNQRSKDTKKFSPEDIEYFLKIFTKTKKSHCPICRKAILNTLNWRGHLYTHCTERKYVCNVCGLCFTRQDHCKYHEMRHKHATKKEGDEEDADEFEEGNLEEGKDGAIDEENLEEEEEDGEEEESEDDEDEEDVK